jgi:UDP-glucose 4-epimerase
MNPDAAGTRAGVEPAAPRSALVLGGAGFIGAHLVRHLAGHGSYGRVQVAGRGVGRLDAVANSDPVEGLVDGLLLQRCHRPDVVFWAIGGASVAASLRDPEADFAESVPPLVALLERLKNDWRGARLVFISSAAVYGNALIGPASISSPLQPMSPYGLHKQQSEELIRAAVSEHGVAATVVRAFSVYGPGLRRQLFWDAIRKCEASDFRYSGGGSETARLGPCRRPGRTARRSRARAGPVPAADQCRLGCRHDGRGRTSTPVSRPLGVASAPEFMGSTRAGDPETLVADPDPELRSYFRMPLDAGLAQYVAWYRAQAAT